MNGLAQSAAQHVPKILLCLAFCAAALHIAVSHTAKVPLTGRRQLILSPFASRPFPPKNQSSLPTQLTLGHQGDVGVCEPNSKLKDQALQLLVDLYSSVFRGTASLAAHHDDLQQRLLTLPHKLSLTHDMTSRKLESSACLNVSMTLSRLPRAYWPRESEGSDEDIMTLHRPGQHDFQLLMTAGMLLQTAFCGSLVFVMAHEVAHGIANHTAEKLSWACLIFCTVLSIVVQMRVGVLQTLFGTAILSWIIHHFVVNMWLSRSHEYEADAIAAAITQAAGYTMEDVVAKLACETLPSKFRSFQSPFGCPKAAAEVDDCNSLQLFDNAVRAELSNLPLIVRGVARVQVIILWLDVLWQLTWSCNNPFFVWLSTHPHWLDRIANVQRSTIFRAELACPGIGSISSAELQGDLQDYQRSTEWLERLGSANVHLAARADDACFRTGEPTFDIHTCVRSQVRQGVGSFIEEEAGKRYSFSVKVAAVVTIVLARLLNFILTAVSLDRRQAPKVQASPVKFLTFTVQLPAGWLLRGLALKLAFDFIDFIVGPVEWMATAFVQAVSQYVGAVLHKV